MKVLEKIAFGGGCHWCTEAVFQALIGVKKVEQGYIGSVNENTVLSEAVIVHFNPKVINLKTLTKIHLYTHKSTSKHAMRDKYRSAIYTFSEIQTKNCIEILSCLQTEFSNKLITEVLPFKTFKPSRKDIQNYYQKNPEKPFCKRYINPKLNLLLEKFSLHLK